MTNPIVVTGVFAGIFLATALMVYYLVARKKRKKEEAPKKGVTLVLLRGATPLGKILQHCVFESGQYVLDSKSDRPQLITYDGRFFRNDPDGEPFAFYDVEAQCLVAYTGQCSNDDDVTLVFHDGTARDVTAHEAEKYRQTHPDEPFSVLRKLPQLWRRWGGARLWSEKNTEDWANIQANMPTWMAILNRHMGVLVLFAIILIVVFGIATIVVQVT